MSKEFFNCAAFCHAPSVPRRKKPIDTTRELAICTRLREAREQLRLEQGEVATMLGLTRDQWQNLERGRTPLRYANAFKLRGALGLSLDWLAGMQREMTSPDRIQWPTLGVKKALESELFSDVALELTANVDRGAGFSRDPEVPQNFASQTKDRAEWAAFFFEYISQRFAMVAPNKIGELGHALLEAVNQASSQFEKFPGMADIFLKQINEYCEWKRSQKRSSAKQAAKKELTDTEASSSVVGNVKPQLPGMLDKLKKATSAPGQKTKLAEFLSARSKSNVPLESVSRWLSGAREPGGEITLLMQYWLEHPELH